MVAVKETSGNITSTKETNTDSSNASSLVKLRSTPEENDPKSVNNNTLVPKTTDIDEADEDDEEEEQQEEEVTRCLCNLMQPPDSENQAYIQCDSCAVWQHQACVGISPETGEDLEKYWCEKCRPELHSLYEMKVNRRSNNREPHDSLQRSNYNWELQKQTVHVEKRRRNTRKTSSKNSNSDDTDSQEVDSSVDRRFLTRTSKRRGKTANSNVNSTASSLRSSRNRSSAAEREELQYQYMLKKVLQESKRDAYKDENEQGPASEENNAGSNEDLPEMKGTKRRRIMSPKPEESSAQESTGLYEETHPVPAKRQSRRTEKKDTESQEDARVKSEEQDSKTGVNHQEDSVPPSSPTPALKPKRAYNRRTTNVAAVAPKKTTARIRGKQSSTETGNAIGTNKNEENIDSQNQKSHMDKLLKLAQEPSRPRTTPDGVTIEEMKERCEAILEFLGRSQQELEIMFEDQSELLSFVENPQFIGEYQKNVAIESSLEELKTLKNDIISFHKSGCIGK